MTKEEIRIYRAAWRIKNRERIRAYHRVWTVSNRDRTLEKNRKRIRAWKKSNPEKVKAQRLRKELRRPRAATEATLRWQKKYPERAALAAQRRSAMKRSLLHSEMDRKIEAVIYAECRQLVLATGVEHDVDHIIPLKYGGWHHHLNLQPLPSALNGSKGDDPFWECAGYKSWRDVPSKLWPEKLKTAYLERLV